MLTARPQNRRRGVHCSVLLVIAALMGCIAPWAEAQGKDDYEITTDRPDLSEGSAPVPFGITQVEIGLDRIHARDGAKTRTTGTPTLLRLGVMPRWELRISSDGLIRERARGAGSRSGVGDIELGFKRSLGKDIGLIGAVKIPSGADRFSSGRTDYGFIIAIDRELGAGWELGFNVGGGLVGIADDDSRYYQTFVSAAFGRDLGKGWGGFVDLYGFLPDAPGAGNFLSVQAGVTKLVHRRMQLDFFIDIGVSNAARHRTVGVGLSFAR